MTKAGFVAVVGRPNSGKSTLLNAIVNNNIAMVSHKINATRKRMNIIAMHNKTQIIFIDTPGIHKKEKLLNKFMLEEALKAINDCDVLMYISSITNNIDDYKRFLEISNKPHILLLSKIDLLKNDDVLRRIDEYAYYRDIYKALIPFSSKKNLNINCILDELCKYIPESPYLYDEDLISTQNIIEIYKEKIREAIFDNCNLEIPYESDVEIKMFKEEVNIDKIKANIIVEKEGQKAILIGSNGRTIKNIGINSRRKIESFSGKKLFLELFVIVKKGWSKNKKMLKEIGYNVDN